MVPPTHRNSPRSASMPPCGNAAWHGAPARPRPRRPARLSCQASRGELITRQRITHRAVAALGRSLPCLSPNLCPDHPARRPARPRGRAAAAMGWPARTRCINAYGPTERRVHPPCRCGSTKVGADRSPAPNTSTMCGPGLETVPIGVAARVLHRGAAFGRGYRPAPPSPPRGSCPTVRARRADLTQPATRGWRADGNLEFHAASIPGDDPRLPHRAEANRKPPAQAKA